LTHDRRNPLLGGSNRGGPGSSTLDGLDGDWPGNQESTDQDIRDGVPSEMNDAETVTVSASVLGLTETTEQ